MPKNKRENSPTPICRGDILVVLHLSQSGEKAPVSAQLVQETLAAPPAPALAHRVARVARKPVLQHLHQLAFLGSPVPSLRHLERVTNKYPHARLGRPGCRGEVRLTQCLLKQVHLRPPDMHWRVRAHTPVMVRP